MACGAVVLAFVILVAAGISGSSLELAYQQTPFLAPKPMHIFGSAKPIRGDEWAAYTPLAVGQTTHKPSFPVVNHNLGVDGQNMLVVGMTGVPVAHISALAKPATWGFFFLDLRRALAWYWWFPFFGCLLALWGLFGLLIPRRWRLGLALAVWFCLSPYVTGWSYWPAYVVFFPSLALCSFILILRGQTPWRLALLTLALGLSSAGFVFVLYPPWQVPLGYLYLFLGIGLVARDGLYKNLNVSRLAALGGALVIAGVCVWWWWHDARPAVRLILDTVYPGQRIELGGRTPVRWLLRGITDIVSLYRVDEAYINQSEVASFVYLFVPLLLAACFSRRVAGQSARVLKIALFVFIGFTLIYMMIGIPPSIARWSMWGVTSEGRTDLALGLAYVILCGFALTARNVAMEASWWRRALVYLTALVWAVFLIYISRQFSNDVSLRLFSGTETALLLAAFFCGVWLIRGEARKFLAMSIVWSALTVFAFNPLVVIPKEVRLVPRLQNDLTRLQSVSSDYPRVLVMDGWIPAMWLMAGGVPVVNGIFYYPQTTLWARLDSDRKYSAFYNRYHHLVFTAGADNSPAGVVVEAPYSDEVKVMVAPKRFQFALTGAEMVASPMDNEEKLKQNSSLTFIRRDGGWAWFRVEQNP